MPHNIFSKSFYIEVSFFLPPQIYKFPLNCLYFFQNQFIAANNSIKGLTYVFGELTLELGVAGLEVKVAGLMLKVVTFALGVAAFEFGVAGFGSELQLWG